MQYAEKIPFGWLTFAIWTMLIIVVSMSIQTIQAQATWPAGVTGGGTGSSDPYEITTAEQLAALADYVTAGNGAATAGVYYKLMNDLDLGGYANWTPIGTYSESFQGNFNGSDKVIKNLAIHIAAADVGLFGYYFCQTLK